MSFLIYIFCTFLWIQLFYLIEHCFRLHKSTQGRQQQQQQQMSPVRHPNENRSTELLWCGRFLAQQMWQPRRLQIRSHVVRGHPSVRRCQGRGPRTPSIKHTKYALNGPDVNDWDFSWHDATAELSVVTTSLLIIMLGYAAGKWVDGS